MSDELDQLLHDAWHRVSKRLRDDPAEALKRSRRRFSTVLTRPMREWCLVVRASDSRINEYNTDIEPYAGLVAQQQPHTITLDGRLVRKLTQPVRIPWPGVTMPVAAKMVGRTVGAIKYWVRKGILQCDWYREAGFPGDMQRGAPSVLGADALERARQRRERGESGMMECASDGVTVGDSGGGMLAPIKSGEACMKRGRRGYVWSHSPIDPGNYVGCPPHAVWGTLWQDLAQDFPEEYVLKVERVPRIRGSFGGCDRGLGRGRGGGCGGDRKMEGFAGWEFICPGRLDEHGEYKGCGRRCGYLYAPQTVWTLALAMGLGECGEGGGEGGGTGVGAAGGTAAGEVGGAGEGGGAGEVGGRRCGDAATHFVQNTNNDERAQGACGPAQLEGGGGQGHGGARRIEDADTHFVQNTNHAEAWSGFEMPEGSGLAGAWYPGLSDPVKATGPRSFACKECWGVRSACMANRSGWNEFIAHISGGLLYGREVPRPKDVCPIVRKRAKYTIKNNWRRRGRAGAGAEAKVDMVRAG